MVQQAEKTSRNEERWSLSILDVDLNNMHLETAVARIVVDGDETGMAGSMRFCQKNNSA